MPAATAAAAVTTKSPPVLGRVVTAATAAGTTTGATLGLAYIASPFIKNKSALSNNLSINQMVVWLPLMAYTHA
jgi:hypothetical protein